MMLPLIFYNGMNLAYIFTDISANVTKECFGQSWVLYVTAIFYGANAFCKLTDLIYYYVYLTSSLFHLR